MCGICGYLSPAPITEAQLSDMTDTLSHRGPDDSGVLTWEDEGYHIGFGHRRLSIFDLSQLGHQPMTTADGAVTVTFNGEIYNFIEIREQLKKDGYTFRSNCDTEVLLYAYQKWGDDCVLQFNGMFAFAIYDRKNHRALFARDRIGKKPFYYYLHGKTLVFGSELKPLMKYPGFVKNINKELISMYLSGRYYPSPHTVFHDTYKLEPGFLLIWEGGEVKKKRYWNLPEKHREMQDFLITDINEAKQGLKKCLGESVKLRLAADVPVGVFLSAGIDSTIVASVAAQIQNTPVKTFTIGFSEAEQNEADRAKLIAEHLKTDHTEHFISESEVLSLLDDTPVYYDEPFADSSQLPTMLVSKLAKQDVTVALTGDGGDELFCGYTRYDKILWAQKLDGIAGAVKTAISLPGISKLGLENFVPNTARALLNNRNPHTKVQLLADISEEITTKMVKHNSLSAKFDTERYLDSRDWQQRRMLLDMLIDLPDEMLCKTDRASMRYALELRCPLMDYNVIEYSFRLPMNLKYRNGSKKWILKQLAYDYVPQKLLDMPKRGFGVPATKWLRGLLSGKVSMYASEEPLKKQDIFDYNTVAWLINKVNHSNSSNYNSILWAFLIFQLWYQHYIEDLW